MAPHTFLRSYISPVADDAMSAWGTHVPLALYHHHLPIWLHLPWRLPRRSRIAGSPGSTIWVFVSLLRPPDWSWKPNAHGDGRSSEVSGRRFMRAEASRMGLALLHGRPQRGKMHVKIHAGALHRVKLQWKVYDQKGALPHPCWHPDLSCPPSRTVNNELFWYSLQQPEPPEALGELGGVTLVPPLSQADVSHSLAELTLRNFPRWSSVGHNKSSLPWTGQHSLFVQRQLPSV